MISVLTTRCSSTPRVRANWALRAAVQIRVGVALKGNSGGAQCPYRLGGGLFLCVHYQPRRKTRMRLLQGMG